MLTFLAISAAAIACLQIATDAVLAAVGGKGIGAVASAKLVAFGAALRPFGPVGPAAVDGTSRATVLVFEIGTEAALAAIQGGGGGAGAGFGEFREGVGHVSSALFEEPHALFEKVAVDVATAGPRRPRRPTAVHCNSILLISSALRLSPLHVSSLHRP